MKITFEDRRYPIESLPKGPGVLFGQMEPHMAYVFSGKSAIARVLEYYRGERTLSNKTSQVLVPEWLGAWVYMTMHNYCFPTTTMNKNVRGIMVYHQWGFPQKMEKILAFAAKHCLFVLEDCAHSFHSSYRGTRVGTFGFASIWSFAKFFPSVVGGAVYSKHAALLARVRASYAESDPALEKKVFDYVRTNKRPTRAALREVARNYAVYPELYSCPPYAKRVVAKMLANGALEKRTENFALLRKEFWGAAEERLLENSEVCPWVVPLFFGDKNKKIAHALEEHGIESGVYHFDVERNMLKPRFVECVAVPCHQGLSRAVIEKMIRIIRDAR